MRAAVLAACLIALVARGAAAKGWPTPAAGPTMTGDPELLFTFDDGPNPQLTPLVLDALARHRINAVFFMVGEMAANKKAPDVIARILREGHIIASHTWSHQDLCRIKDEARAAREIDDGRAAIEAAAGIRVHWFRTPYGVRCDRLEAMLAARELGHFHWDLDPQEWKHGSKLKTIAYVTRQLGAMTGRNVLLMHDIKKATAESLPEILDWIAAENARRKQLRLRRIRIIQAWELAIERLPAGTIEWLGEAAPRPKDLASAIARALP